MIICPICHYVHDSETNPCFNCGYEPRSATPPAEIIDDQTAGNQIDGGPASG